MVISDKQVYKVIDLYFGQRDILYTHLYNSYDKFIEEGVRDLLIYGNNNFSEKTLGNTIISYGFEFSDIEIIPPTDRLGNLLTPETAREENLTYSLKVIATIKQVQRKTEVSSNKVIITTIGKPEKSREVAVIPVMVGSKYCTLRQEGIVNRFPLDPGGYFIVNGSEKVVMCLERMADNKPFVFTKKDSGVTTYTAQVNSRSRAPNSVTQVMMIKMKKDNIMSVRVPILTEMPIFILVRALGVESDKEIVERICPYKSDKEMINLILVSLKACVDKEKNPIITQDEALNYLVSEMKGIVGAKTSETDNETRDRQKRVHLLKLLNDIFLPHVTTGLLCKGYYLCYVITKLLNCFLGRVPVDDRDSYINKRVDLPGDLLEELFRQQVKKVLNDCERVFEKRNNDDENPVSITSQIKSTTIEQGIKSVLLTGTWAGRKKGVAQSHQRLSYSNTISSLRRLSAPTVDASTNKLTSPRHLHMSQIGPICIIETPEGVKVGLTKSLSMMGNITVISGSQVSVLNDIIVKNVMSLRDTPVKNLRHSTKVFLNGEWLGVTTKPAELESYLRSLKRKCEIDPRCAVIFDTDSNSIFVYCDNGRPYRPTFVVKDNKLVITENIINEIGKSIKTWEELILKHPNVIEYIDTEELPQTMIMACIEDLEAQRRKLEAPPNKENKLDTYGSVFVRATHTEIHPSMILGVIAGGIPFCNHNQGPRGIFQSSQARQAIGIYEDYRHRLDISHILYNPFRPLVSTRSTKYTNMETLPNGENVIVAIMCYSGYNQEDSLIFNQTAIDRGLFVSKSLKKHSATVQRNSTTSQDDSFERPDPTRVIGMKPGSYDKLSEKGYAPEETVVTDGDILIGKVVPIHQTSSGKAFKDDSEAYKSHTDGVIDKVYTGIYSHDGYETIKIRTRSEKTPIIGDKFCSRHGQKGTIGITLPLSEMPYTKEGIVPDIIIGPQAFPSRMTVGQFIESFVGKVGAIKGIGVDGTPFRKLNLTEVANELVSLGYNDDGTEEMTSGITGEKIKARIFIGPMYYNKLKHMVSDKIHSRARGPRTMLTRQPPEGRARDGGLRVGEMERDAFIAHGLALTLKERMLETADIYDAYICDGCGMFAQRKRRRNQAPYPTDDDTYHCTVCRDEFGFSKVTIPYAFKLLVQELISMNIRVKLSTKL